MGRRTDAESSSKYGNDIITRTTYAPVGPGLCASGEKLRMRHQIQIHLPALKKMRIRGNQNPRNPRAEDSPGFELSIESIRTKMTPQSRHNVLVRTRVRLVTKYQKIYCSRGSLDVLTELCVSETSRDVTAAIENGNIGPDLFGFYTSEVAELLSQDDDFVPFSSPQISGLAGNLHELDRDESINKNSCIKKENNGISGSASLYTNGIGSLLPEFKTERLKSLLRESVLTLGQEVNEMIDPVLSICRIRSCLRYKNSLLTLDGSGCEIDQVERPQKKLKVLPHSLESESEHVHLDITGEEVSNDVTNGCTQCHKKCTPQLRVESDGTKIDDDLRYILESDGTKVEELMKKYSDELSSMICHMEQKLEELLDIVMSSCRSMTRTEKQQLYKLIQSLPPGNLDRVAEIIRRRNPSKNTSCDEIHVDLDDEDIVTIWRLYYYVRAVEKARTLCED